MLCQEREASDVCPQGNDTSDDHENADRFASHHQSPDYFDDHSDPKRDLYAPIPHGEGQTLLREALVLADHNAYHLGQLVLLRRTLEVS